MFRLTLFPAVLALSACAATPQETARSDAAQARDQARLAARLAGYTAGEPTNCLQTRNANVRIYGDTLLYEEGRRLWRTQTSGGCFGLRRDDIIITQSFGSAQLCRGDIIRTVDRTVGFPSGACTFGDFVPYTRDRR